MESGIHVILKGEELGHVFAMPITNSLLMTWLVMALLIGFAFFFGRKIAMVPGKLQAGIEWAVEGSFAYIKETLGTEQLAKRFFPLIASIFLFVALANVLEFVPGVGSLGILHEGHALTPLLRAPAADLNFTLALAMISFFTIEITGLATLGVLRYGSKFVNLKSPVGFAVGLIELVSNLGRLISFSFRLFGNIFAGEVMILVAIFFLPYVVPAPLMMFEMFIGLVQGLVFAMLTLFFIKLAIMEPEEAH